MMLRIQHVLPLLLLTGCAVRQPMPTTWRLTGRTLIPPGVEGTWAPVIQTDAAGKLVKEAWYFNGYFHWL